MADSDSEIGVGVIADRSTKYDVIGFEQYTESLKTLLLHPSTEPPLTVSIEGDWGSGKSSFMKQLRLKLDDEEYITVEFNPWRHEDRQSMWAAFVQKFVNDITSNESKNPVAQLAIKVRLIKRRISRQSNLKIAFATFLSISGLLLIALSGAILLNNSPLLLQNQYIRLVLGSSGIAVGALALWKMLGRSISILTLPIRSRFADAYPNLDYPKQKSFLDEVDEDLGDLIYAYAGSEPVFVFIDDLDRCDPSQAAELMRATNLLLEKRPQLILVIGMDREKVAAGLAAEHEEVLPYLQSDSEFQEIEDDDQEAQSQRGLEFGYRYLEKFIQLPFRVPQAKERELGNLLSPPDDLDKKRQLSTETEIDDHLESQIFNSESELMEEVTKMVTPFFEYNPRQIKKFGNVYRLQSILSSQESILINNPEEEQGSKEGITLQQLAKFVAISVQHPRLASLLQANPQSIQELEAYAIKSESDLSDVPPQLRTWATNQPLLELLRYQADDSDSEFSFRSVSLEQLVQVSSTIEERGGADTINTELLSDEERVEHILRENDGRIKQSTLIDQTGWSSEKVTQLADMMHENDRLEKLRLGRETLLSLPEESADSPE